MVTGLLELGIELVGTKKEEDEFRIFDFSDYKWLKTDTRIETKIKSLCKHKCKTKIYNILWTY